MEEPQSASEKLRLIKAKVEAELERLAEATKTQAKLELQITRLEEKLAREKKIRMDLLNCDISKNFEQKMKKFADGAALIAKTAVEKHNKNMKEIITNYYREIVIPWDHFRSSQEPGIHDKNAFSELADHIKKTFPLDPETVEALKEEHAKAKAALEEADHEA